MKTVRFLIAALAATVSYGASAIYVIQRDAGGGGEASAPTSVTVSNDTVEDQVTCSWSAATGATGYNVYVYQEGNPTWAIKYGDNVGGTSFNVSHNWLSGHTVRCAVSSLSGSTESARTESSNTGQPTAFGKAIALFDDFVYVPKRWETLCNSSSDCATPLRWANATGNIAVNRIEDLSGNGVHASFSGDAGPPIFDSPTGGLNFEQDIDQALRLITPQNYSGEFLCGWSGTIPTGTGARLMASGASDDFLRYINTTTIRIRLSGTLYDFTIPATSAGANATIAFGRDALNNLHLSFSGGASTMLPGAVQQHTVFGIGNTHNNQSNMDKFFGFGCTGTYQDPANTAVTEALTEMRTGVAEDWGAALAGTQAPLIDDGQYQVPHRTEYGNNVWPANFPIAMILGAESYQNAAGGMMANWDSIYAIRQAIEQEYDDEHAARADSDHVKWCYHNGSCRVHKGNYNNMAESWKIDRYGDYSSGTATDGTWYAGHFAFYGTRAKVTVSGGNLPNSTQTSLIFDNTSGLLNRTNMYGILTVDQDGDGILESEDFGLGISEPVQVINKSGSTYTVIRNRNGLADTNGATQTEGDGINFQANFAGKNLVFAVPHRKQGGSIGDSATGDPDWFALSNCSNSPVDSNGRNAPQAHGHWLVTYRNQDKNDVPYNNISEIACSFCDADGQEELEGRLSSGNNNARIDCDLDGVDDKGHIGTFNYLQAGKNQMHQLVLDESGDDFFLAAGTFDAVPNIAIKGNQVEGGLAKTTTAGPGGSGVNELEQYGQINERVNLGLAWLIESAGGIVHWMGKDNDFSPIQHAQGRYKYGRTLFAFANIMGGAAGFKTRVQATAPYDSWHRDEQNVYVGQAGVTGVSYGQVVPQNLGSGGSSNINVQRVRGWCGKPIGPFVRAFNKNPSVFDASNALVFEDFESCTSATAGCAALNGPALTNVNVSLETSNPLAGSKSFVIDDTAWADGKVNWQNEWTSVKGEGNHYTIAFTAQVVDPTGNAPYAAWIKAGSSDNKNEHGINSYATTQGPIRHIASNEWVNANGCGSNCITGGSEHFQVDMNNSQTRTLIDDVLIIKERSGLLMRPLENCLSFINVDQDPVSFVPPGQIQRIDNSTLASDYPGACDSTTGPDCFNNGSTDNVVTLEQYEGFIAVRPLTQ